MKKLLVPVDFSVPSNNAVAYAAGLANIRGVEHIILLANCYTSAFEQLFPSPDFVPCGDVDVQTKKSQLSVELKALKERILKKLNPGIQVQLVISKDTLLRSIIDLIEKEQPDMVIVGSNSSMDEEESFIGTHLIELAKASPAPVMIVPPNSDYHPVENALVPIDFRSLKNVDRLGHLEKIKNWPRPNLCLLNVDPAQKYRQGTPDPDIDGALKQYLNGYDYRVCHSDNKNTLQGIINYADQNHLQMIIALPGAYSFLYRLTHQSISYGLATNANQPVLILK